MLGSICLMICLLIFTAGSFAKAFRAENDAYLVFGWLQRIVDWVGIASFILAIFIPTGAILFGRYGAYTDWLIARGFLSDWDEGVGVPFAAWPWSAFVPFICTLGVWGLLEAVLGVIHVIYQRQLTQQARMFAKP